MSVRESWSCLSRPLIVRKAPGIDLEATEYMCSVRPTIKSRRLACSSSSSWSACLAMKFLRCQCINSSTCPNQNWNKSSADKGLGSSRWVTALIVLLSQKAWPNARSLECRVSIGQPWVEEDGEQFVAAEHPNNRCQCNVRAVGQAAGPFLAAQKNEAQSNGGADHRTDH